MASIDTLINDARTYAADLVASADAALDTMQENIDHIGYTNVSFPGLVLPEAPEIPDDLVAPELATVDLVLPTEPDAAPQFQAISAIEAGTAPTLSATAPTITLPSIPSQLAGFTEVAPVINTTYTFPEAPAALDNPLSAPSLTEHTVPTAPTIALPSFDSLVPVNDTEVPSDLQAQYIAAYNNAAPGFVTALQGYADAWIATYNPRFHTQLAAIEDKLEEYIAGGTGLSAAVEDAIYERSRTKQEAEARRASDAAFDQMAGRGWTVPGASVAASIRAARQAAADNNAIAAREIVELQAKMEQQNLQWALTASAGLRQSFLSAMLNYHGNLVSINSQAVQYATNVVDTIVRVYNLTVEQFRASLAAYQADAEVYGVRLKAALAYVDLYKAEIDALQAQVQVDQAKVALYRGQLDGMLTLANVYKTRVDVVVQQAGLEKLKLDVFRTQTEAYMATVNAKRAEYDAYQSAINGQEALVRIFTAQVGAYGAQVTGYKSQVEAQEAVVRAQVAQNEGIGNNYRAQIAGYQAVVSARGDVARTQLQVNNQVYQAFDSQVRAVLGNANLRNDIYRNQTTVLLGSARLEVEALLANQKNSSEVAAMLAKVGISAAGVYQASASAYLASQNTLVSQQSPDP